MDQKDIIRKQISELQEQLARLQSVEDEFGPDLKDGAVVRFRRDVGLNRNGKAQYAAVRAGGRWWPTGRRSPDPMTWQSFVGWLSDPERQCTDFEILHEGGWNVSSALSREQELRELLGLAWTVIANAGWDGLDKSEGWQEAASRWRDRWTATIGSSRVWNVRPSLEEVR